MIIIAAVVLMLAVVNGLTKDKIAENAKKANDEARRIVETAKKDVAIVSERAISGLQNLGNENEFLEQLVIYLIDRKK